MPAGWVRQLLDRQIPLVQGMGGTRLVMGGSGVPVREGNVPGESAAAVGVRKVDEGLCGTPLGGMRAARMP